MGRTTKTIVLELKRKKLYNLIYKTALDLYSKIYMMPCRRLCMSIVVRKVGGREYAYEAHREGA
ncbi:MAG: hypothetical protein ACPL2N_07100, partial [Candidatus Cryosericum sp.]